MRTLDENYSRNVNILKENMNRGLSSSDALRIIDSWRGQFEKNNMFGAEEKKFINNALKVVEDKTHINVKYK